MTKHPHALKGEAGDCLCRTCSGGGLQPPSVVCQLPVAYIFEKIRMIKGTLVGEAILAESCQTTAQFPSAPSRSACSKRRLKRRVEDDCTAPREAERQTCEYMETKESVSRKREWAALSSAAERLREGMKAFTVFHNNEILASLIGAISLER